MVIDSRGKCSVADQRRDCGDGVGNSGLGPQKDIESGKLIRQYLMGNLLVYIDKVAGTPTRGVWVVKTTCKRNDSDREEISVKNSGAGITFTGE